MLIVGVVRYGDAHRRLWLFHLTACNYGVKRQNNDNERTLSRRIVV